MKRKKKILQKNLCPDCNKYWYKRVKKLCDEIPVIRCPECRNRNYQKMYKRKIRHFDDPDHNHNTKPFKKRCFCGARAVIKKESYLCQVHLEDLKKVWKN